MWTRSGSGKLGGLMYTYVTKERVRDIIKNHFGQGFKRTLLELTFENVDSIFKTAPNIIRDAAYLKAELLAENQFQEWLNENLSSDWL